MNRGNKKARGVEVLHGAASTLLRGTVAYGRPMPEKVHLLKGWWSRDEEMPELVPSQRDCSYWMSPHWKTGKELLALWVLGC